MLLISVAWYWSCCCALHNCCCMSRNPAKWRCRACPGSVEAGICWYCTDCSDCCGVVGRNSGSASIETDVTGLLDNGWSVKGWRRAEISLNWLLPCVCFTWTWAGRPVGYCIGETAGGAGNLGLVTAVGLVGCNLVRGLLLFVLWPLMAFLKLCLWFGIEDGDPQKACLGLLETWHFGKCLSGQVDLINLANLFISHFLSKIWQFYWLAKVDWQHLQLETVGVSSGCLVIGGLTHW